jgi:hypothetical protein
MAEMDQFHAIGRAGRSDHARASIAGGCAAESAQSAAPPTYTPRTADPAVLEAAERAKAERQALI